MKFLAKWMDLEEATNAIICKVSFTAGVYRDVSGMRCSIEAMRPKRRNLIRRDARAAMNNSTHSGTSASRYRYVGFAKSNIIENVSYGIERRTVYLRTISKANRPNASHAQSI